MKRIWTWAPQRLGSQQPGWDLVLLPGCWVGSHLSVSVVALSDASTTVPVPEPLPLVQLSAAVPAGGFVPSSGSTTGLGGGHVHHTSSFDDFPAPRGELRISIDWPGLGRYDATVHPAPSQ